ncbi:MAG TPA: hypothetical protein PKA00_11455 [Saprospiraceae bacterium]|nr:hypothetical protein [Saprospiraceae bacterium]HMQ83519.1 hypothetical protein [Saprospiraceae bacterium]
MSRAIATLELLSSETTARIVDFLQAYQPASALDILVHTALDNETLDVHLEQLQQVQLLHRDENLFGCHFRLNTDKLMAIRQHIQVLGKDCLPMDVSV